ncbi:MAG: recombination mediator RecR [Planctomycetota bacterium]
MPRPSALDALAEALARLPGIGTVSSDRIAYHLLAAPLEEALELAAAIRHARERIESCSICGNFDEEDPCWVCRDPSREKKLILVVEGPRELASFDAAGYRGLYHVLRGRVAPLEGIGEEDLTISELVKRVEDQPGFEVCLAMNPDLEGESTARLIAERLSKKGVATTRIARGIPAGAHITQVQQTILSDALEGRRKI